MLKRLVLLLGFPVEFGWVVLFELEAFFVRWFYRFSPRQVRVLRKMRGGRGLKINFGCGDTPFPGWINVDGIPNPAADLHLDLRCRLPLDDASVRLIFAEHVIEHLRLEEARGFLHECHRLLEPGGAIRIITPDLEKFARAYIERDHHFFSVASPEMPDAVGAMNLMFRRGVSHHYIFDSSAIQRLLSEAGFERVYSSSFRASAYPELNLDDGSEQRRTESLYVEAAK